MPDYRNFATVGGPGMRPSLGQPASAASGRFISNPSVGSPQGAGGMADWAPLTGDERSYYDGLFHAADTTGAGSLAGQAAVAFFMKSGLDVGTLKQVWDIADSSKQNFLTRPEFYCAMRLIAMAQSGAPLTREKLIVEGTVAIPLARLQGVAPPPGGLMYSQGLGPSGPSQDDPYFMLPEELAKYDMLFPSYDPDGDGFVTGAEAVPLFTKSGLDRGVLKQVWDMADSDRDARLSRPEFAVAMHLIVCISKKGLPVPPALPPSLARPGPPPQSPAAAAAVAPAPSPSPSPLSVTAPLSATRQSMTHKTTISEAFSDLDVDSGTPRSAPPPTGPPPSQMPPPLAAPQSPAPPRETSPAKPKPQLDMLMGLEPSSVSAAPQPSSPSAAAVMGTVSGRGVGMGSPGAGARGVPQYSGVGVLSPHQQYALSSRVSRTGSVSSAVPSIAASMPAAGDGMSADRARFSLSQDMGSGGGGGGGDVQDLMQASEGLVEVSRAAAGAHAAAATATRAGADGVRRLVQRLHAERVALAAALDGAAEELAANQRALAEATGDADALAAELQRLRAQRQSEERAVADLRAAIAAADARRQGLSSDVSAERAMLQDLQSERVRLSSATSMRDAAPAASPHSAAATPSAMAAGSSAFDDDGPFSSGPFSAPAANRSLEPPAFPTNPAPPVPSPKMGGGPPPPPPKPTSPMRQAQPLADPFADAGFDTFGSSDNSKPAAAAPFEPFGGPAMGGSNGSGNGGSGDGGGGDAFAGMADPFGVDDPFGGAAAGPGAFDAFPAPAADSAFDAFGQR